MATKTTSVTTNWKMGRCGSGGRWGKGIGVRSVGSGRLSSKFKIQKLLT